MTYPEQRQLAVGVVGAVQGTFSKKMPQKVAQAAQGGIVSSISARQGRSRKAKAPAHTAPLENSMDRKALHPGPRTKPTDQHLAVGNERQELNH